MNGNAIEKKTGYKLFSNKFNVFIDIKTFIFKKKLF